MLNTFYILVSLIVIPLSLYEWNHRCLFTLYRGHHVWRYILFEDCRCNKKKTQTPYSGSSMCMRDQSTYILTHISHMCVHTRPDSMVCDRCIYLIIQCHLQSVIYIYIRFGAFSGAAIQTTIDCSLKSKENT